MNSLCVFKSSKDQILFWSGFNFKTVFFLLTVFLSSNVLNAIPPKPPAGFRWVINELYSDEFNGEELDTAKWYDHYKGWKGRPPALFHPKAVSLKDGYLVIRNGVLDEPQGDFTLYGGAVTSKTYNAFYGYYECKFKASKIPMSTTFWMSNKKVPFEATPCTTDSYSLELDIVEAIGSAEKGIKFMTGMKSNTRYRYIACGEEKEKFYSEGTYKELPTNVGEDFHIYGAWWKDARKVLFYANNQLFDTVYFRTDFSDNPFDRPMKINMVTETYNFEPAPSVEEITNNEINASYYDWVRAYNLVPVNEKIKNNYRAKIYDESIDVLAKTENNELVLEYTFKTNIDRIVNVKVYNQEGIIVHSETIDAYSGFGCNKTRLNPDEHSLQKGVEYKIETTLVSGNEIQNEVIDSKSLKIRL